MRRHPDRQQTRPHGIAGRTPASQGERIAVFAAFSGEGGVERMVANLARGLIEAGYPVDFLMAGARSRHVTQLPQGARVIQLGSRTLTSLPGLALYLRREQPRVLLAAKHRGIRTAVLARRLSRSRCMLVGRLGTTVSAALSGRSRVQRLLWYRSMRQVYPEVDRIVAVSEGVAEDIRRIAGLSGERVRVVPSPVVTPELGRRAGEPCGHPGLAPRQGALIVGAGRLTRQKDFATLIQAFARLETAQPARLVILGDGAQRTQLEALARSLGVADRVAMPGFVANPYPFLAGADLFVLSSRWEGSPNVLTEALALGTPVVATDCPSGPREILQGGRYGRLVPVADPQALTGAMAAALAEQPDPERLREAVAGYTLEASTRGYIRAMGLQGSV